MKEKKHIRSFKESIEESQVRRINEDEQEEDYDNVKGKDDQDIRHWEVVLKYGKPFLKISTDDDIYYCDLMTEYRFNSTHYDYDGD